MEIKIIKNPITNSELLEIAKDGFGTLVKAVVDVRQGIMAIGGELHADEEVLLTENENSKREDTWGINIYVEKNGGDWIEFDSMINLKPAHGNSSRGVDDPAIREKIENIVRTLIVE